MAYVVLARLDTQPARWSAGRCASRAGSRACGCAERLRRRALQRDDLHLLRGDETAAVRSARRALEARPEESGALMGCSAWRCARSATSMAPLLRTKRWSLSAPTAAIGYVNLAHNLTARGDNARALQTLQVAEQFLGELRSFRLDAAVSYAHPGRAHRCCSSGRRLHAACRRLMRLPSPPGRDGRAGARRARSRRWPQRPRAAPGQVEQWHGCFPA